MGTFYKRLVMIAVATAFSIGFSFAQTGIKTHIVDKGETIASIASLYCITEKELIELNHEIIEDFYVGMELNLPPTKYSGKGIINSPKELQALKKYEVDCTYADQTFKEGNYSKATKVYTSLIKQYEYLPICYKAYYGRALSYYNQGKWKNAIKDLESVISHPYCTSEIKEHCNDLLENAKKCRAEQLDRREEIWGALFATAAVTATAAVVAHEQSKNHAHSTTISNSGSTSNIDYLLDPRYTIMQVNAQNESEYQQLRQLNPSLTREQFMQIKAQSYQSTENMSFETSNTSESSLDHQQTYTTKTTKQDCPSLKINNGKWYCINTGKCGMCGGDGLMDGSFGQGPNALKCTLCNGTGKCKYCQK